MGNKRVRRRERLKNAGGVIILDLRYRDIVAVAEPNGAAAKAEKVRLAGLPNDRDAVSAFDMSARGCYQLRDMRVLIDVFRIKAQLKAGVRQRKRLARRGDRQRAGQGK